MVLVLALGRKLAEDEEDEGRGNDLNDRVVHDVSHRVLQHIKRPLSRLED